MSAHRIEWRISRESNPTGRVICDATEGAACRSWCDEGCEYHCDHPKSDKGACGLVPWFDDTSLIGEMYDGPDDVPVRDGAIDILPDGHDCVVWQYAEATS